MKLIYYPDHDTRYAHIHPLVRDEYPDEIHIGHPPLVWVIRRTKNFKDLTEEDVRGWAGVGVTMCLFAKDVSYREGCID